MLVDNLKLVIFGAGGGVLLWKFGEFFARRYISKKKLSATLWVQPLTNQIDLSMYGPLDVGLAKMEELLIQFNWRQNSPEEISKRKDDIHDVQARVNMIEKNDPTTLFSAEARDVMEAYNWNQITGEQAAQALDDIRERMNGYIIQQRRGNGHPDAS